MHSTFQAAQVPPQTPVAVRPDSTTLAATFARNPWGPHDEALRAVLTSMRAAPVAGKLVVIMTEPHRAWRLARLPARRGLPLVAFGPVFVSLAEVEVEAFRIRLEERLA